CSYALQIVNFLLKQEVKMILIACNTASASAQAEIEKLAAPIPVLNVITCGTEAALSNRNHRNIGVIGTLATISSGAYKRAIKERDPDANVFSKACPLLVPLAEEGWIDNDIARQVIHQYLQPFEKTQIDSLILGCTHYPLFTKTINKELHDTNIRLIDSAATIAQAARNKLEKQKLLNNSNKSSFTCYV